MSAPVEAPVGEPHAPVDALAAARARLERSRAGLREALVRHAAPAASPRSGWAALLPRAWKSALEGLLARVREQPAAAVLIESLSAWWHQHPWRDCVEVAGEQMCERVIPALRRNARSTLLVAVGGAALLVLLRPWRWRRRGRRRVPFSSRLYRWLLAELSRLPLQSMLAAIMLMASRGRHESKDQPPAESAAGTVGDV